MPIIMVNLLAGRPAPVKRALLAALTEAASRTLDVPERSIRVLLSEVPADHWAVGGVPIEPPGGAAAGGAS